MNSILFFGRLCGAGPLGEVGLLESADNYRKYGIIWFFQGVSNDTKLKMWLGFLV